MGHSPSDSPTELSSGVHRTSRIKLGGGVLSRRAIRAGEEGVRLEWEAEKMRKTGENEMKEPERWRKVPKSAHLEKSTEQ